ncbi:MAG: hypothetical protein H6832_10560 [Planctomycetes bacterium]|nr:hypothetical protein [Planctomycetota bacterium]
MWSHLIQLLRARRAIRAERFDAARALLADPIVRDDRRAHELRQELTERLVNRARRRLDAGQAALARHDLGRIRELDPDRPGLEELSEAIEAQAASDSESRQRVESLRMGFDRALDEGRLNEARDMLSSLREALGETECQPLQARLESRRSAASKALREVREALDRGLEREAREGVDKARRLCADSLTFRERLVGLSAAWAKERWDEVQNCLAAGRNLEAARALADWWDSDPDSDELSEARDLLVAVADAIAGEARNLAIAGDLQGACRLASQAPRIVAGVAALRRIKDRLERILFLLDAHEDDPRRRADALARILAETQWSSLETPLAALRKDAIEVEHALTEARRELSAGDTEAGKDRLSSLLVRWPGCDEAKALLDGLLADERERRDQLEAARVAVREGRLDEAQKRLLRLISGGFGADEARNLLRDVERLRLKVSRECTAIAARLDAGAEAEELLAGIDQVRRHQVDSAELDELEARALRRRTARQHETAIRDGLERRDVAACLEPLRAWIAEGGEGGVAQDERRALEALGREIEDVLRSDLRRGRPAFVDELALGLRTWKRQLGIDLDPILAEAGAKVQAARSHARKGLEAAMRRSIDEAAEQLASARELAPEEPEVLRLAHRLGRIQGDKRLLEEAFSLAESDPSGARELLASRGPTPRPLGSLVLELKDHVERQGDLENGCLLQVEEAGEFLVFTDDRLRIGNATGNKLPQIPVLARIRAHHATFVRTLSFHGGSVDRIEPVDGEPVTVNGATPGDRLQHGDRLVFGGVLPMIYLRPSPQSTSALLRIEKGFECRGTSRILWMKQGGRDGRVAIGRGREVHIRVPHKGPELYLQAPGRGRLCVHFEGDGEIDGVSFRGTRELHAGAQVRCGQVQFRVLPIA